MTTGQSTPEVAGQRGKVRYNGGMQIRTLTRRDLDQALAMWAGTQELGPVPRAEVEQLMAHDADLLLCAEGAAGRLVAVVMGSSDGRRGWVSRLVVAPGHRRSGVARQLVTELERRLAERGCRRVNLLVYAGNTSGRAFWEQAGYGPMEGVVAYSKPLDGQRDEGPGC